MWSARIAQSMCGRGGVVLPLCFVRKPSGIVHQLPNSCLKVPSAHNLMYCLFASLDTDFKQAREDTTKATWSFPPVSWKVSVPSIYISSSSSPVKSSSVGARTPASRNACLTDSVGHKPHGCSSAGIALCLSRFALRCNCLGDGGAYGRSTKAVKRATPGEASLA